MDDKPTTALLDRLGHHSHILTTRGSSYRSRNRELKEDTGGRSDEKGGKERLLFSEVQYRIDRIDIFGGDFNAQHGSFALN